MCVRLLPPFFFLAALWKSCTGIYFLALMDPALMQSLMAGLEWLAVTLRLRAVKAALLYLLELLLPPIELLLQSTVGQLFWLQQPVLHLLQAAASLCSQLMAPLASLAAPLWAAGSSLLALLQAAAAPLLALLRAAAAPLLALLQALAAPLHALGRTLGQLLMPLQGLALVLKASAGTALRLLGNLIWASLCPLSSLLLMQ
jgi:hypothetical protein